MPKDVDLRDFPKMPLKVSFLLNSDTWLLTSDDEAKAAITLCVGPGIRCPPVASRRTKDC